jgi:hypothetical protein
MLTTPLKIGIAVACLVGIAAIIAVDQVRMQRRESMTITTAPPTVQTALPPVVAPMPAPAAPVAVAPAPAEPVVCPAPVTEAPAKPAAAPAKESAPAMYTVAQGEAGDRPVLLEMRLEAQQHERVQQNGSPVVPPECGRPPSGVPRRPMAHDKHQTSPAMEEPDAHLRAITTV